MCCYDLIVSQETGFVAAIVKQDLHAVMLLAFFFFDYWRTMSQIKVDYFNSEIYMNTYIYRESKHNDV